MVAHAVIERMLVEAGADAVARQRVVDDFREHCAGAVGHEHDFVGEIDRLVDVMRDHEHGLPGGGADAAHLVLQRAAGQRVERRERLVHHHDLRLDRQRTRNADALLHAAGEFGRALVLRAGEADAVDEALRVCGDLGGLPCAVARGDGIGDVAHHRAPRQQRVALEDDGAVERGAFDRFAIDNHCAG